MATIQTADGRAFVLPTWFLGTAAACFFTVSVMVAGTAVKVWADVRDGQQSNIRQDVRLDNLERLNSDIASIKTDIAAIKSGQQHSDDKLDRLIERRNP